MNSRQLYRWVGRESKRWTKVNRYFRANVAMFSRAVILAGSSQIRQIAGYAPEKAESARRRLQRFVSHEGGLSAFFEGWAGRVVRMSKVKQVMLVVDETKLKNCLGVMTVGMLYEGRCIPLAWRVYIANDHAAYPAEGQSRLVIGLLNAIRAGVGTKRRVCVLADRGIGTSPLLMRGISAMHWTFLFRVTKPSKLILPDGQEVAFYDELSPPQTHYAASGTVFKKRGHIPAHVRVLWKTGAKDKWALVTNDPALTGWEYAQRMWIEEAFRDFKSFGWHLEQADLSDPKRIARLLVPLTVAYAWCLFWGAALERSLVFLRPPRSSGLPVRHISLFRRGRQAFTCTFSFG